MSIFIKNVELKSNVVLAPMAGYTDFVFRKMCGDFGAGLTVTEMVSAKALHYDNEKTKQLLIFDKAERPKAVQIFGHEPDIMAEAVKNPLLKDFDIIDINMGCPAPKIFGNGDGCALMGDINLAEKIISACTSVTDKPITVKFRLGLDENNINALEFAKMCERAGASAITIHARTKVQGYSGKPEYSIIKEIKNSVKIPVFANGDCRTIEDYLNILKCTGADGVAIGRGAIGKPEIFKEILTGSKIKVDKLKQIKNHYTELLRFYPEIYVVKYMRSHLAGYLSGEYKNSEALVKLLKMEKIKEIFEFLSKIFNL